VSNLDLCRLFLDLTRIALLFLSIFAVPTAHSRDRAVGLEPVDVYFAGVAFTGGHDSSRAAFAQSDAILNQQGVGLDLSQALMQTLQERPPAHFRIKTADLAQLDGSTSAIAMALAVDRETISVVKAGAGYNIRVELAFQALFFDFREKTILISVPLTLERMHTAPVASDEIVGEQLRYLFSSDREDALLANITRQLHSVRLPGPSARRIQVSSVELDQSALGVFASEERPLAIIEQSLGNELTRIIGEQQNIGLLPFMTGEAIGGAMAARFADGRVYTLKIPEADYRINVVIGPVQRKLHQQTTVATSMLYGVYFTVNVTEPVSGKRYFDQRLRKGQTKTIPITQTSVDDAASFYETLLIGFSDFAVAISKPRSDWVKSQVDAGLLRKQLRQLSELIEDSR